MEDMYKKFWPLLLLALVVGAEGIFIESCFYGVDPFPYDDFYYKMTDHLLRDGLFALAAWLLYRRRSSLCGVLRRYGPVCLAGLFSVGEGLFMAEQLSLEWGLQTFAALLAGLANNLILLLLAAYCFYRRPGRVTRGVYFAVYAFTMACFVFDGFYFWQTSMHVESVVFQNLNIYAAKGYLAGMNFALLAVVAAALLAVLLRFKTDAAYILDRRAFGRRVLAALAAVVLVNLGARVLGAVDIWYVEDVMGRYADGEIEKTRYEYRKMLSVPVNANIVAKALFDTDKISVSHTELRVLTEKDKAALAELGIPAVTRPLPRIAPAYDKIVMLVLESVHRDYINYYNSVIPAEATPFLNSLLRKYPHLDRFYTSSVPTTQGLNAMFRSHLIFDRDLPGHGTPSLFRSVQAQGMRGIFLSAASQYYADEVRAYPEHFGMAEYYAREYLESRGCYKGASGWGFHNDVMYEETLNFLEAAKNEKLFMVTKTLDMHQPSPYTGFSAGENPPSVQESEYKTVRGMYWVDKTLEHFFSEVERRGLADERTLFIITSDHNPHSGGEYTKIVTNRDDKLGIAPIPLIFVSKNTAPLAGLRAGDYASQIDLAPTLLYLLDMEVPELFMGRNLLQPVALPYAIGYFGGKAYYWSEKKHFVEQMDEEKPDSVYKDALSNYIVHKYTLWHQ